MRHRPTNWAFVVPVDLADGQALHLAIHDIESSSHQVLDNGNPQTAHQGRHQPIAKFHLALSRRLFLCYSGDAGASPTPGTGGTSFGCYTSCLCTAALPALLHAVMSHPKVVPSRLVETWATCHLSSFSHFSLTSLSLSLSLSFCLMCVRTSPSSKRSGHGTKILWSRFATPAAWDGLSQSDAPEIACVSQLTSKSRTIVLHELHQLIYGILSQSRASRLLRCENWWS